MIIMKTKSSYIFQQLGNMHLVAIVAKREPAMDKPQELLQASQPKSSKQKIKWFMVI